MGKVLLMLTLTLLLGCSDKNSATTEVQSGQQLYSMYCSSCHKENGEGQFLIGVPQNRDTPLSMNEVAELILHGRSDMEKMPTFSQLTPAQAYAISSYLKHKLGNE